MASLFSSSYAYTLAVRAYSFPRAMSVKRKTIKRNPRECECMYINRNASLLVRPHYRPFVHKNEKVDLKAKERHELSLCLEKEIGKMNVSKWRCGCTLMGLHLLRITEHPQGH